MPEGVEHVSIGRMSNVLMNVPLAVMPEGVEHRHGVPWIRLMALVPLAVMPEGVEHRNLCGTAYEFLDLSRSP